MSNYDYHYHPSHAQIFAETKAEMTQVLWKVRIKGTLSLVLLVLLVTIGAPLLLALLLLNNVVNTYLALNKTAKPHARGVHNLVPYLFNNAKAYGKLCRPFGFLFRP